MTAQAFDLAERLQTPVIVMSDLDLGMNDHFGPPLAWDPARRYDRGKVLDADRLEALTTTWGRYLDTDGDGIGSRTLPGTHPERGVYFTRGTSHDEYSAYTEDSNAYLRTMERLARKWQTARSLVPGPRLRASGPPARLGAIFFGSTTPAAYEALEELARRGLVIDTLRLRAFPSRRRCSTSSTGANWCSSSSRTATARCAPCSSARATWRRSAWSASPVTTASPVASRFLVQALESALAERGVSVPRPPPAKEKRHDLPAPDLPPPGTAAERGRLHPSRLRGRPLHPVCRLRPRLDLQRHHPGLLRTGPEPHRIVKLSGIGCSSKTPAYFLNRAHGFNTVHGRMPLHRHRRQHGQPRPHLPGRVRRRRHRLHRHGPVRARGAAQPGHALHRHEQRLLRPDQGPVLGHRGQGGRAARRAGSTRSSPSTCANWPSSWARASWPAASPATSASWCP